MSVVPGTVVQATVKSVLPESSVMENVFHFIVQGPAGSSSEDETVVTALTTRLEAVWAEFDEYISQNMGPYVAHFDIVQWEIDQWGIFRHLGDQGMTVLNTAIDDDLPVGVCALLTFSPIYLRRTGRKYFGGFTEGSNMDEGHMNAVTQAAVLAGGVALTSTVIPLPGTPSDLYAEYCILNRSDDLYNLPISLGINENWSYQRRRKQYVGS